MTELVVRPCVAMLHSHDQHTGQSADPEVSLIPRLDAKEVAAVFTAPFRNFLSMRDGAGGSPGDWYQGAWTEWHQSNWRSKFCDTWHWHLVLFFFFRLGSCSRICFFFVSRLRSTDADRLLTG
jgi:hypothetical protein